MIEPYDFEHKGILYTIKPSKKHNKKYDVFYVSPMNDKVRLLKYHLSFGDNRYKHYKDIIGHYKHLNHLDKNRKINFFKRHKIQPPNQMNPKSSKFWSSIFLWGNII